MSSGPRKRRLVESDDDESDKEINSDDFESDTSDEEVAEKSEESSSEVSDANSSQISQSESEAQSSEVDEPNPRVSIKIKIPVKNEIDSSRKRKIQASNEEEKKLIIKKLTNIKKEKVIPVENEAIIVETTSNKHRLNLNEYTPQRNGEYMIRTISNASGKLVIIPKDVNTMDFLLAKKPILR